MLISVIAIASKRFWMWPPLFPIAGSELGCGLACVAMRDRSPIGSYPELKPAKDREIFRVLHHPIASLFEITM
jgi:hypothetical protein